MSAHFYANLHHIYNHSKIIESLTCKKLIGDPNINNVMLVMLELHTNKSIAFSYLNWLFWVEVSAVVLKLPAWLLTCDSLLTSQHIPFRKLQYIFPNVDKVFLNVVLLKADCNVLASGECHSQLCRHFAAFSTLLHFARQFIQMETENSGC